jgi:hypothetical protein
MLLLPVPNIVFFNAQGTCLIEYNRLGGNFDGKGGMRLINNAGTDWLGRLAGEPVAVTTPPLTNQACTVNVAGTVVTFSGTDMNLSIPVTFNPAGVTLLMGTFIQSSDVNGYWTDFRQFGNWVVPGSGAKPGPFVVGVTPNSGAGSATFTVTVGHTSGANQLSMVNLLLNTQIVGGTPCQAIYFPQDNTIALIDEAGTSLVSAPLGQPVSTSRCAIGAGSSRTISGSTLTLNLPMTFNAANLGPGTKNVYVDVFDIFGAVTHWVLSAVRTVQ